MSNRRRRMEYSKDRYTRIISPRLGWLGVLGLLGFLGVLPIYSHDGLAIPFPFLFFGFFGFFGFYYEGKMSHTLKDERYQFNAFKAEATANKAALMLVLLVTIFSVSVLRIDTAYFMICILLCTIGIALGLSLFLGQYLLYRYDCEDS
ncbi:MAG: DUF3796 domain-containing protein [Clostridia bacterium]|nr:DUF3796 domain-containing protein [Clostridia bacterium]